MTSGDGEGEGEGDRGVGVPSHNTSTRRKQHPAAPQSLRPTANLTGQGQVRPGSQQGHQGSQQGQSQGTLCTPHSTHSE